MLPAKDYKEFKTLLQSDDLGAAQLIASVSRVGAECPINGSSRIGPTERSGSKHVDRVEGTVR